MANPGCYPEEKELAEHHTVLATCSGPRCEAELVQLPLSLGPSARALSRQGHGGKRSQGFCPCLAPFWNAQHT